MAKGQGRKRKGKAPEGANQQAPAAAEASAAPASDSPVTEAAPEAPTPALEPEAPAAEPVVEAAPEAPVEAVSEAVSEAAKEPEKAPEPKRVPQRLDRVDPDDQEMSLDEAAGSMVDGFKESWLPAIRAKARSMGAGDRASRRVWRGIFIAWGGVNILR